MDEAQLDQQVQEALRDLQAEGTAPSVEHVARRVGRRTESVLAAIRRLTGSSPVPPDVDMPAEQYPEVVSAQARVDRLTTALADVAQTVTEADAALTQAELAAADAVAEGREVPSLMDARQRVEDAAERARLFGLALQVAKARHGEALATAQAQHWAAQWRRYQDAIAAFDAALRQAYALQEHCREIWNLIGQPGEAPLLKAALGVWPEHFHPFLQGILDMPAEDVRRGSIFAPERRPA